MRIVMLRSNPVAPYPRLEKTANSLKKNGHDIHVLAWDREYKYSQKDCILNLSDGDVNITRFGIPGKFGGGFKENGVSLFKFQMKLFVWLFKNRNLYDAIHAYDFDTGYIALKCSKLFNKKLIYDIPDYYIDSHGLKGTRLGKFIQKLENSIINKADATIICSENREKQIEGTSPRKLIVIHNAPVSKMLQNNHTTVKFQTSSTKLKIAYIGILANGRFIKEIANVVMSRNDCEFHIGGFGELEAYFEKLSNENENIFYYGKLPYNETLALEKECDIITAIYDPQIPNNYYAAPNKFYEALMLGKPLIMVKNTGMDSIVTRNEIGEVIDYTVESLNNAINKLTQNRNQWDTMSSRAKKLYEKKYSWEIMERRLIALYRDV